MGKFWNKAKSFIPFLKESRTATVVLSQYGSTEVWAPRDYENFAKEAYMKNSIAFACIVQIARAVSSVKWGMYRQEGDKRIKIDSGPMVDLIKRPNPEQSWSYIMFIKVAFLLLAGNSFIEKVGPTTGPNVGTPKELWVLRPDRMKIDINKDARKITGYTYSIGTNRVTFEVDDQGRSDILHYKLFHPTDDLWGLANTEPCAREIDTFNEATKWNKKLLENEARPGMVFTFSTNLTDPQFDRLEKQLNEKFSGADNAHRNLILEGGDGGKSSAVPYGFNPAELDFIEGNRELARRICIDYGVPPQLLGIKGDQTYANFQQAREVFWEDTVLWYLELIKGEENNWLFGSDDSSFLDYDLDQVPAFEEKRDRMWKRAQTATFISENEKREMVGFETMPGLDVILVPATMIPIESAIAGNEENADDVRAEQEEQERAVNTLISEGFSEEEAMRAVGLLDDRYNRALKISGELSRIKESENTRENT